MFESSVNTVAEAGDTVSIEILHPDGSQSSRELASGDPLFVGSAESCGLRLEAEGVAAVHCWLRVTDGELWVQNWADGCLTLIGETRIEDAAQLTPGEVLRIGQARITLSNAATTSATPESKFDSTAVDAVETPYDEPELSYSARPDECELSTDEDDASTDEDDVSTDEVGIPEDSWDTWDATAETQTTAEGFDRDSPDAFDRETIELLRAEVEFLQSELLERDARITELSAGTNVEATPNDDDDAADVGEETEALLERLETMLQELSQNDLTVRQLEQLLQTSEEALEAEREERAQLESWLEGIESRLVAREQEWQSEVESLTKKLQQTVAERDRAEKLVGGQPATPVATENQKTLVDELRREVTGLREELEASQNACDVLRQRIAATDFEELERTSRERIEEELREERLQLAEERTELARLRAELTRSHSEADVQQADSARNPDPVTAQVQVLRQHLREIHEQEKTERDGRRISKRIARLWKRVDG